MADPYVWDPDRVLQITDLGRNQIICIGRAARRFNSRCTWTIEEPSRSEASSLLRSMARKPPTEVENVELWELAGLCLCYQAHEHQQHDAFMELQSRLPYACDDYKRFRTLQKQNIELRTEAQNGTASTLSAEARVTAAMKENTNLLSKVNEQGMALINLKATELDLKTQSADMSRRLDRQTTTIAELQESKSSLRRTSAHLEQLLQREKLTVAGLETSRTGLEGQLTELGRQLSDQKVVADELEASKSDLQGQLHELHQQLNKQNSAVGHLEGENRTLKDQHTNVVAELGNSQLKIEQMRSELQSVQTSKVDLQHQLNEAILLLNNTWQTRLRNYFRAWLSPFKEVFRRVCHGLAMPSVNLKRVWSVRGLFRVTEPVAGQYSEV